MSRFRNILLRGLAAALGMGLSLDAFFVVAGEDIPDRESKTKAIGPSDAEKNSTAVFNLKLTGIVDVPPIRKALLILETPDGKLVEHILGENEKRFELELVSLDAKAGKAVARYRGRLLELSLIDRVADSDREEREKDISHTSYHTRRAQLDREADLQQRNASELSKQGPAKMSSDENSKGIPE